MGWLWWPLTAGSPDEGASTTSPPPSPVENSLVVYHAATTPANGNAGDTSGRPHALQVIHGAPHVSASSNSTVWCSFVETHGRFAGPSLVVCVLVALVWTVLCIVLNVAPTWTINVLFNSHEIDDGDFWLIASPGKTAPTATAFVVAILAAFALYYLYLLFLLVWRRKDAAIVDDYVAPLTPSYSTCLSDFVKLHFSALDAEARPYLKVSEELPEIAYQTVLLAVYMERGVAVGLVVVFATVVALNCFVRCYRVLARETYHERNDSLANAAFQFVVVVLFPVAQLGLARASFALDRSGYALRTEYFEVGAFERLARFAQPEAYTSTHVTSKTLLGVLILTGNSKLAVATLGLHLALLWRWHDIVLGCLLGYKTQRLPMTGRLVHDNSLIGMLRIVKAVYWLAIKLLLACLCVSKRFIPRVFALLLGVYGVGVLVVTSVGLVHSRRACEPYDGRCVLQAITFRGFSQDKYPVCPCIMYVNQPDPITTLSWSQWSTRMDVTDDLRDVAASGRLEVVQIVDRELSTLPDPVGDCSELRELVLVRTMIKTIPVWLMDLDQLHVVHVAGDVNTTLDTFPTDTFARKPKLQSIRFESLHSLSSVPAFSEDALDSLRLVVFSDLPLVRSLPVMGHVKSLESLVLSGMMSLQRLPLLPTGLKTLRVQMPTALCCNGYLADRAGGCLMGSTTSTDLTAQCRVYNATTNTTAVCLTSDSVDTTQTTETQRWLNESDFQCSSGPTTDNRVTNGTLTIDIGPTQRTVAACDGQLYRECSLTWPLMPANVSQGMCLGAARLEIVHCAPKDTRYEALRRAEIRDGAACDAQAEQWLGCR